MTQSEQAELAALMAEQASELSGCNGDEDAAITESMWFAERSYSKVDDGIYRSKAARYE